MANLDTLKKQKRDTAVTVRLPKATVDRLKQMADDLNCSQADIIEHLLEAAYAERNGKKR